MDKSEKKKQARGLFPKYSLLDALRIAESIKKNNNMHPYNRLDIASSLNNSPNSSNFRLLIISSGTYGLTTGSYIAEKIALTDLGSKIVSPTSDAEKNQGLKEALFNVALFKQVFSKFDQGQLPRMELLINTLNRENKLPLDKCEEAYKIIIKNAKELGILKNVKGTDYVRLDLLSKGAVLPIAIDEEDIEQDVKENDEIEDEQKPIFQDAAPMKTFKPKVFISHSKNKKIVSQIKQILEFGQFEFVIAEEKETTAIPISEKVFGLMKQCNCAIINLSVDGDTNDSFHINENVLIEIGAAFLQYNKKVILLVDERISNKLPSNLRDLYRSEYGGDQLSFETAMKLQNALSNFRKE